MDIIYRYDPLAPLTHECYDTAAQAIQALSDGNARFAEFVERMHERTAGGAAGEPHVIAMDPLSLGIPVWPGAPQAQAPFAMVLGCSDARVPTEQIFDLSFNDLFVVRVAGNVLGTEGVGSMHYAARQLGESVKVLVVLGHTQCGAVAAAVAAYLSPHDYIDIAFTLPLRSLVDRIQISVRGTAQAIQRVYGKPISNHPQYAQALHVVAVYINAALTALDAQGEILRTDSDVEVVFGVYDLVTHRVSSRFLPITPTAISLPVPVLVAPPQDADGFVELARQLVESEYIAQLLA
jgi:carbonic anhydrase